MKPERSEIGQDAAHPTIGRTRSAKVPDGDSGARRNHRRRPAAGPADAGLRRRRLRQDPVRHGVPGARRDRVRRAGRLHGLRGDRRGAGQERRLARASTSRRWSRARSSPSTTSASSAARSRRPASTISRGCSSAWATPSTRIGAKRVVLDTIESLFAGLPNTADPARRAAPAVPLAEGQGRHRDHHRRARRRHAHPPRPGGVRLGLRHLLDHRVTEQVSTRRLRIVKYRGSVHGTNEYPFLIDEAGLFGPADHLAGPAARGLDRADLDRASPGSTRCSAAGATSAAAPSWSPARPAPARRSLAAHFVDAACRRGERCLYFAFEESREPDRPQHALDRHRPGAVAAQRAAALLRRAAHALRPGDAPGDDAQADRRVPAHTWWSSTRSPTSCPSARLADVKAMLMR